MSDSPVADVIMRAFDAACSYEDYLAASPKHADAWRSMGERIALTPTQREMLSGFTRQMRVLVVSGICCGDCVRQGPAMAAIAAACEAIDLRWIDRDDDASPIAHLQINGGQRVPVAVFMAEDGVIVSIFGDRTLSCYRWIIAKETGPTCPLPGAPVPEDVLEGMVQDWMNECERVQLLLRLSPRLLSVHGV